MPTTPSTELTLTQRPISLRTYLWTHAPPKRLSSSTITTTSTESTTTTTQEKSIFLSPIGEVVDCEHFRNKGKGSGANQLSVPNYGDFYAYCEMESEHGWIVLQKFFLSRQN
ncbi:unnamed protein product [Meloidogyne enterolobii]|uniref:Uncharacterized protein n=1 Tax=Meloidogyne enterolobii TaxID=390850 RepID=A0ACB0YQ89_MELEN